MSYHNTDIAACNNGKCQKRDTCLRWLLGTNMDEYQVFAVFEPDSTGCYGYMKTSKNENDNGED